MTDTRWLTIEGPVTYTSAEIVELAGVTYRRLDWACRRGYLTPAIPAHGSGTGRKFDKFDLALVKVAAWLQTQDIPVERAFHLAVTLLAGRTHRVVLGDEFELIIRPIPTA